MTKIYGSKRKEEDSSIHDDASALVANVLLKDIPKGAEIRFIPRVSKYIIIYPFIFKFV